MKHVSFVLVMAFICQFIFSQNQMVKRVALLGSEKFDIALNSKANESLITHLKIPDDYELRNKIVSQFTNQTREKDELGYLHERYDQYYKGIKIEHSDIRTHYFNDQLIAVNGEYFDVPYIDISVVISKEMAIQKAIEHIGAKKYLWEDEQACESLSSFKENAPSCYPVPETVICLDVTPDGTSFRVAYKVNIRSVEPVSSHSVYVDAKNGKILNKVSRFSRFNPVTGTAVTRYSGTQSIPTQLNNCYYDQGGNYVCSYKLNTTIMNGKWIQTLVAGQNSTLVPTTAGHVMNNSNNWNYANFPAALDVHWGSVVCADYYLDKHVTSLPSGAFYSHINYFGVTPKGSHHDGEWYYCADYDYIAFDNTNTQYVSLDIIAHEVGHKHNFFTACVGMANYHLGFATGNSDVDCINEGLSDIWAACVQNYANKKFSSMNKKEIWLGGDEISGGPFYSLSNPASFGDYDTYQNVVSNSLDHWKNIGVIDHWFYIISEGKSGTNALGMC